MAPGINGRQTGTVPKTKTHNDSSRDYPQARREQSFNNIPNNLVTLDWQPAPDIGHSRTRKTSNTQSASLDYYDIVPESSVPHDSSRVIATHYPHGEDQQISWGAMNHCPQELNGRSEGSTSTSCSSRRSRTPRNVLPDRESKSSNINKMPDRNQVVSRLNQIRDYIKQTSSLMDTLKNSGDSRHLAQYHKLSKMIAELRESESRLQSLLPSLGNASSPELELMAQDTKSGNSVDEGIFEAGNSLPDHVSGPINSHSSPASTSGNRGMIDNSPSGRSHSEEPSGAVLKSSDSARRNELKMKVEESQRRLQALQEHQAALLTLQQKAQDQLKEAKVAQGILMARAVGIQCSGPTPQFPALPAEEEHSASCPNEVAKDSQGTGLQHINSSSEIQGNMQHLSDRLHTLQELYENRNQLVQMLGERDEELVSEHLVLQDKLQELQYKKQHMDHLVAEFQALNNLPGVSSASEVDAGSSKAGSEEADFSDGEPDYQVVREKIAELNMMKAQLAQLKGIMSAVENRENINGAIQNGIDEGSGAGEEGEELEQEEQAVNLRRQKRDKVKGSSRGVVRSNSNTSASGSTKPDNIVQASSGLERTRDIQHKTIQLQEAKNRLQQLQDLLAAVSDFHSRGQPVPEQYIDLLSQEASREEGAGDATRLEAQTAAVPRIQRQSVEREKTPSRSQPQEGVLVEGSEVTLEAVQAMTHDLRQQTLCLQEEREKLISARKELSKLQRGLPLREKKTNTQVDAQTHQLLLQAELQAKRRELEELMRKDQGQTSAINQDVCSEVSADKSETPGYSFLAEGTTNATWGSSTQGTLDDLAEQDNDIQEQSAGYSSDEGQEDEEEENRTFPAGSSQQLRLPQLKNSSTNNSTKDPNSQSVMTTRDLLSMSMDSGRISGNINTNHSNSTSIAGSTGHAPPPVMASSHTQRQGPSSHNVWRKESTDSGTSAPRAVWTPSSQQARRENLCSAEDLVSASNLEASSNTAPASVHNPGVTNTNSNAAWWQQQAVQLQHQLEVTSNLCQSMLLEQAQQQQQQHGNNLLAAVAPGNNTLPYWNFPPPPYPTPPHPQVHSIATGAIGSHLIPANVGSTTDMFYQHLLAASQLQQQQMLLTTVNQCCHLLWLQQREMVALRAAVHTLQEKTSCGNGSRAGDYSPSVVIGQPEEAILVTSNQNSAHPTPHQSQSNLTRLQQTTTTPNLSSFNPHQNLKLSYSGGLFQSPEELTGSSGVTSAHSLPNLSHTTTSANSVFSPHHADTLPSNPPLNNMAPSFNTTTSQAPTQNFPSGTLTLTFPMNNNVNFNNRSQQQPLSSLIQCSAPQPGSGAPWLQQGTAGGTPGLLQGHTTPSPVPALNNQVPPGNRANNYWDNFRSYSRQNHLSTSTKSNEGVSHSPSPLVDRSHNTLRGSMSQSSSLATSGLQPSASVLSQSIGAIYSGPEQNGPVSNMSRKEKLNTEQYQSIQDNLSLPGPTSHNNMTDTSGLHYQLVGTPNSSISRPRSRNRHNCSDFQLHPNTTRSRAADASQRPNACITQDLQNVLGVRSSVGCTSSSGEQDFPNHQNFTSTTEFQIEPMEARNISLTEQELQCHQNFPLTSESLSAYHSDQRSREEVESSQLLHVSKPQGASSTIGVNKRRNPKAITLGGSQSQQECPTVTESSVGTTDRKPQQIGNPLFEALSESVYSEVAALISANETRPHFLIQLFRDLQMISSDPLRQRTLQSIQEVVSRYLASGTAANQHTESHCQLQTDNQQSNQVPNEAVAISTEHVNGSTISSDDENAKNESTHYHMAETLGGHGSDAHALPNLIARCDIGSGSRSIAESEEGATAMLPSTHSSPHALPRNAAWSIKDGLSLPTELPGRSNKLDWEVQAVLVDLLPFLKAHLDDTCSSTLLEAVRRLTLQLVPAQNLSLASPTQHSSQHSRLGCCYQGQLDALLEDALLKFQGCRLRDVSEELLTVVAEVLLSELTFLRLVDTVSRGDNSNESTEECCKNPAIRDHDLEEHSKNSGTVHQPSESTQQFLTSEMANHSYCDSQEVTLGVEAYNGDLAEADQSHHENSSLPELEAESSAAITVGNEIPIEHSSQAEGAAAVESCLMENSADLADNDHLHADDMVAVSEGIGDFNKTEAEEEWEVEQDREQGLDRVPTRLSTDQQRGAVYSGSSSPERDGHSLVQHPVNQIDAPNP